MNLHHVVGSSRMIVYHVEHTAAHDSFEANKEGKCYMLECVLFKNANYECLKACLECVILHHEQTWFRQLYSFQLIKPLFISFCPECHVHLYIKCSSRRSILFNRFQSSAWSAMMAKVCHKVWQISNAILIKHETKLNTKYK